MTARKPDPRAPLGAGNAGSAARVAALEAQLDAVAKRAEAAEARLAEEQSARQTDRDYFSRVVAQSARCGCAPLPTDAHAAFEVGGRVIMDALAPGWRRSVTHIVAALEVLKRDDLLLFERRSLVDRCQAAVLQLALDCIRMGSARSIWGKYFERILINDMDTEIGPVSSAIVDVMRRPAEGAVLRWLERAVTEEGGVNEAARALDIDASTISRARTQGRVTPKLMAQLSRHFGVDATREIFPINTDQ